MCFLKKSYSIQRVMLFVVLANEIFCFNEFLNPLTLGDNTEHFKFNISKGIKVKEF